MLNNNSKPCLEQTQQGFSVSYNQRFLYSKYNPAKSILQTINNLSIQPGTLILCNSPALPYGLSELSQKLPQDCFMLLCEVDSQLFDFETEQLSELPANSARLSLNELRNLPFILQEPEYKLECGIQLPPAGTFRRAIRIDFSAGIQFFTEQYDELYNATVASIKTFWVNRVTLTKFGRRYSKNFFTNLKKLSQSKPIQNYFQKITKPILVLGAGESINKTIEELNTANIRNSLYILCADTALQACLKHNITPDGVFIEEAQFIISKAFIGALKKDIHIFAGLSSVPLLSHFFAPSQFSYFATEYTNATFIKELTKQNLLPPLNKPMGSVGLTTVYYALQFRQNTSIPVLLSGLDFSYSAGITHAKGTMAHTQRLLTSNRLQPVQNYSAAFTQTTRSFSDKSGKTMITTPSLQGYASLFVNLFSNEENLYDITTSGIPLNLPQTTLNQAVTLFTTDNITTSCTKEITISQTQIENYFNEEHQVLQDLRNILSGKTKLSSQEQSKQIEALARPREYLYLHFPDGHRFTTDISFLKRIRAEIDYFLKFI